METIEIGPELLPIILEHQLHTRKNFQCGGENWNLIFSCDFRLGSLNFNPDGIKDLVNLFHELVLRDYQTHFT